MKKAVCVLVKVASAYLSVTRPDSKQIGLVGGKVDPGETELEAIVREVKEEVGLTLDPALFQEAFTDVCTGEVDYLTTTFMYPELDNSKLLEINTEEGLSYMLVTKDVLCNVDYSPFASYNIKLFEKVETLLKVTK
jgi:8-oxo-dGTP pyrophosphatase MutT (NUDIX family)